MSVEYTKEQAEQVLKDENKFNGMGDVLFTGDEKFLNHKFPPKIEYVGKVWKTTTGIIFLCDKEADNGNLGGYGLLNSGSWLKANAVSHNRNVTQATPTEWIEALKKYAESKYNVGDEVRCLSDKQLEIIASFNHAVNKINCLNEWWATVESGVALLMSDGIWADIITPAKSDEESDFDKLRYEFNEMKKVLEDLKRRLKNKDELVSHLLDARGYCMNYTIFNFKK